MPRNPNWTRDELILALDLYFRSGRKQLDASVPEVIELSKILNSLHIHRSDERNVDFRNSHGISMKLANFSSIDPEYLGVGLRRGGKLDKEIWDEYSTDIEKLNTTAKSIRQGITWISTSMSYKEFEREKSVSEDEFPEGRILERIHKYKERSSKASQEKKAKVLKEKGKLECEVCGFDYLEVYGELGYGFAESHHIVPVSQLVAGQKTKLGDLAIVCANCHRMLHRSKPLLSISELRVILSQNS